MRLVSSLLVLGCLATALARAQGLSDPGLPGHTIADEASLVPLHVGAEWRYTYGEFDPYTGDSMSRTKTYRVTGTTDVEGVVWYRVEVLGEDDEPPSLIYYWRNASEGFYEALQGYGGTPEEAVRTASLFKYPGDDQEVYVSSVFEDGTEQRLAIHLVDIFLDQGEGMHKRVEAVCYALPPDAYSQGGFVDGELQTGSCFLPGTGRVLISDTMFGLNLTTEAGTYLWFVE